MESSNGEFVESIKKSFTRRLENEQEYGNRLISYISLSLKKIVHGIPGTKRACFQPVLQENIRPNCPETANVYVNKSSSTQLNKNVTFI